MQAKSRWFNGTIMSAPSYLGQTFAAQGPGEGLAVLGLVYGGALIGNTHFGGINSRFVSIYADPQGLSKYASIFQSAFAASMVVFDWISVSLPACSLSY